MIIIIFFEITTSVEKETFCCMIFNDSSELSVRRIAGITGHSINTVREI